MSLSTTINSILNTSGSGTLYDYISGQSGSIVFGWAKPGTNLPIVVYNIVDSPANYTSLDTTSWEYASRIQFDIYVPITSGPAQAEYIKDLLVNTCHGASSSSGYSCLLINNNGRLFPDNTARVIRYNLEGTISTV